RPAELPPAPAPDHRSELLAGLHGVIVKMPCSMIAARLDDGTKVTLNGLTALGEASELEIRGLVRQSIAQLSPTASVVWQVQRIKGPYCPAVDLLRPASGVNRSAPSPELAGPGGLRVTMPDFPGSLTVDVYSGDGLVHHLFPGPGNAARKLPANAAVPIARPAVSPATDIAATNAQASLLTAIASSVQLPGAARPADEPAAGYLKELGDAIARVRSSGATVTANAISVDPASGK
ncbi:MAG TPA: hypothetical protein VLI93_08485, partial [Acetobacteraceae bacterium]|nr:hypothetical protein [Acetobacteraceae bacterium]